MERTTVNSNDNNNSTPPAPSTPEGFWPALRRVLKQPRFVGAALLLLICAVGINAAEQFMRLHFRKEAVPLRVKALDDASQGLPARIGPWVQVSVDQPLKPEIEDVLGTKQYVMRDYVNSDVLAKHEQTVESMFPKDLPEKERMNRLLGLQLADPSAVLRIGVTYYTGLVDTVAHIPDRCYVADGYEPTAYELIGGDYGANADGTPRQLEFRYIQFQDTSSLNRVQRNVGYVFHVNGHYEPNPLGVRKTLQNLFERHGYYAKIEMMVQGAPPRATAGPGQDAAKAEVMKTASIAAMKSFLSHALPEVERCLPDWKQVKAAEAAK